MQPEVQTGGHRSGQEQDIVISKTEYDVLTQKVAQLQQKLLTVQREQDGKCTPGMLELYTYV